MRQFHEAKVNFETCLKFNNENEEANTELTRSNARISESISADYDFESIMNQYLKKENLYFDVADYTSASITVVDKPNKSKGVIATEDIKKGTLLVLSKEISAVFSNEKEKNTFSRVNTATNSYDLNDGSMSFVNTVYKMQSEPEVAKQIYSLYSGSEYNRDEQVDELVIDISRVDQIHKLNSFRIESNFNFIKGIKHDPANKESGLWYYTLVFLIYIKFLINSFFWYVKVLSIIF